MAKIPGMQSHTVQTEDGYFLTLLRVDSKSPTREDGTGPIRPPVLLVHGLICSGTQWCLNSPDKDLPYKLLNEGYDCWIANLRGTPLSREHAKVPIESADFWDFSWHEMAKYDIPAMINYILETTKNDKLFYIGHSMGCAVFFAAMDLNPDYCSKIEIMIALAPSVYGTHIRNRFARLSIPVGILMGRIRTLYSREIFPHSLLGYAKKYILPYLTPSPEKVGSWVLKTFGKLAGILGSDQIESARMASVAEELPAPTSLKTFCHGTQCFFSRSFRQYDYGKIGNFKRYGQPIPPLYDLAKTKAPVATFYSQGDQLCTVKDVTRLSKDLPNLIEHYGINDYQFAHTDFMFGKDAHTLVYNKILEIFSKFGGMSHLV